jgi:hypothetical protein
MSRRPSHRRPLFTLSSRRPGGEGRVRGADESVRPLPTSPSRPSWRTRACAYRWRISDAPGAPPSPPRRAERGFEGEAAEVDYVDYH